jgi:CheY-like chemotaxis protein
VTDTGCGMPRDVVEKAFDPFFTTKPTGAGTGLGLSQVYGFVKQSHGHVRLYSEVGEGTTVRIYLPRSNVREEPTSPALAPEQVVGGNQESILVVEDDPDVRAYVTETLRGLNYRVMQAPDGESALALLRDAGPIDLLLTDIVMPGMNGRILAEAATEVRPGLKVLFMTGYSRNAIVHQGRLDPGVSLIQKPFSQSSLAAQLRRILARR